MSEQQKSYTEIAEVLKEFGISGITEELVHTLEKNYVELPEEIIFDKTAALLTAVGDGTFNQEIRKGIPSANRVYSFDVEVVDEGKMYTRFLEGVSALSAGELIFADIQENTEDVDWENGTGKRTVSFLWNGNTYNLEADVMNDWFDCNVANQLNELIVAKNTGKQLFFASDGYQECIVFYCDKVWANAFQEKTGLRLAEKM